MNRAAHLALVVAVAALVAGCGGSSGGAPTAASSSSSAPSTPSSGGSLEALALTAAEVTKIDPRSTNLAAHQLTLEFSQSHAGKTVYSAAVYQYEGDLFDGVYVFRGSPQDALTAVRRLAHYIAPKLATAAAPAV